MTILKCKFQEICQIPGTFYCNITKDFRNQLNLPGPLPGFRKMDSSFWVQIRDVSELRLSEFTQISEFLEKMLAGVKVQKQLFPFIRHYGLLYPTLII